MLVLAAVSRTKGAKGRTSYAGDGLNLASFRESSELEFGADDAFIMVPSDDDAEYGTVAVTVKHLKARHTQPKDLLLEFDRRTQRFTDAEDPRTWKPDGGKAGKGKLQSALTAAWANTSPAADDDAGAPFGSGDEL